MSPVAAHVLLLYGGVGAVLAATMATARRPGDPAPPRGAILKTFWPFVLLALWELLQLRAGGKLIMQWLLPGVAALAPVLLSRSATVIRWSRRAMIVLGIGLCLHGGWLMTKGFVTRPLARVPGKKVESRWYTPLTGLQTTHR